MKNSSVCCSFKLRVLIEHYFWTEWLTAASKNDLQY